MRRFFSIKTRFSRKFFELRIVWPWMMVRSKALIKADLLDTYNMFIRPPKNFLFASEVRWFHEIRTFSRIFNLKTGFLKSTTISKWAVAYVCRNKNRFTHRMITSFVSADSYGLEEVFQKKFWIVKSLKIFFHASEQCPCCFLIDNFLQAISA